jgi:hypothetical protein
MSRILRCSACHRRIRGHHPHIGIEDVETGQEFSYHATPSCQRRCAEETAARLERGKVYALHHYHSSACPDAEPGWGCTGGCFDEPLARAN